MLEKTAEDSSRIRRCNMELIGELLSLVMLRTCVITIERDHSACVYITLADTENKGTGLKVVPSICLGSVM